MIMIMITIIIIIIMMMINVPFAHREFNELPHIFEDRIEKSLEPVSEYLASFRSQVTISIAKCASCVFGSIIAALLLGSLIGEGLLLHVKVR